MSDLSESFADPADGADAAASRLNTAVAVLVALTATFTAVCNIKDGNIVQAMQKAQAAAVDTWPTTRPRAPRRTSPRPWPTSFAWSATCSPAWARRRSH